MKPILIAGAVVLAAVVGAVYFCVANPKPSGRVDALMVMAARDQYARDLKAQGSPLPASVSLQELLRRRLLRPTDVSGFDGAEVAVSLNLASLTPNSVLMSARMPDGAELDLLNDGSVRQKQ